MADLREFRKANSLTQKQLGAYLGLQESFISKIEHGKEKLPVLKLQKLLGNGMGWDTSALTDAESASVMDAAIRPGNGSIYEEVIALRKENEMLRAQVKDLKEREAHYWETIKILTSK